MARTLASGDDHFTGGEGDGYARELFGPFVAAASGDDEEDARIRRWFGVFGT